MFPQNLKFAPDLIEQTEPGREFAAENRSYRKLRRGRRIASPGVSQNPGDSVARRVQPTTGRAGENELKEFVQATGLCNAELPCENEHPANNPPRRNVCWAVIGGSAGCAALAGSIKLGTCERRPERIDGAGVVSHRSSRCATGR
jgi:hypothetical protein